ncbi:DEAD/DEAH box helicase family protein [Listeria innocua]|uniref:SNF2-related protein n=1 Tax=Listeria innocua TaxID=1642 RepID=UPI001424F2A4|nr:SNF2-related protein [Listeria innocua]EAH4448256.1 helicase SNF2 [Listeria innocua]EDO1200954.1 helicase SNF2 [Listeria innocua]EKO3230327.1 DEAD/DEAH box helicase family protein [Listeria innocua]EKQ5085568.1 DEAD/DEAH box helicase family protein [Listeria innocua]EKQ5092637.1 DEAD/DEAH box helicase family protein [Listeria innocua]
MSFSVDIKNNLKSQYTNGFVDNFYIKLLTQGNLYQRVSGYFTSAGVDLYADGLEELAKNGGEIQFIISKEISKDDYERIKAGYNLREELKSLKISEQNDKLSTKAQQQLGNLAFMIANSRARVKIALMQQGVFHDKFGLIHSDDEVVFFNGSANETKNGISKNYESISVDVSWDSSNNVQSRILESQERFTRLWNNKEHGITVVEASELAYEEIAPYQQLATITNLSEKQDCKLDSLDDETINFRLFENRIIRIDNTTLKLTLKDRKLRVGSDLTCFFEEDNSTIRNDVTYKDIEQIIEVTQKRAERKGIIVTISTAVEDFITRNKYSIEQYKILGAVYKGALEKFPEPKKVTLEDFSKVVQQEVSRPLRDLHLRAAYYKYEMMRAANFSVPGAGKTAMLLGVFAYLNRFNVPKNEKINRILVVSPINAFDSWKREFKAVFGDKKKLISIDAQNKNFKELLQTDWGISNLILVNYESLPGTIDLLKRIIDTHTLLVFDEVHRIKNPHGQRAQYSLELSQIPKFRYVLTGTPIPNKYSDIFNFLHILYGNEYNGFFGWDVDELNNPKIRKIKEINEALHPFFWRTNKKDLNVPEPEKDITIKVSPSLEQKQLAEAIYYNESSSLAKLIRLIQASTNPALLNSAINYDELMSFNDDESASERISGITKSDFFELLGGDKIATEQNQYKNLDVQTTVSPKFASGIELVEKLVAEGKKVLVWGLFVDTIIKIKDSLKEKNLSVNLIYGGTPKDERVKLIDEFRDGGVQILVSNPQTLGESISLHQSVHDAVYFEYDFNLTYMLQSRDRIHRLGLKENDYTRYYYLQTESEPFTSDRPGYIDEKIYRRLKDKEQIMYDAVDDITLSIEYSKTEIIDAMNIIDDERKRIRRNE